MPFDASPPTEKPAVLDPAVKQRWIDALRSGRFKQCRDVLTDYSNSRCVMGVYNEITWGNADYDYQDPFIGPALSGGTIVNDLVDRNNAGESFASLADWIEREL